MTTEEAQALAKGDAVYYRSVRYHNPNAIISGYGVHITRTEVYTVTKLRVKTSHGSFDFASLMSESDGLAAIEAFCASEAKRRDDVRRVAEAGDRIRISGFGADVYHNEIRISASGPDACERIADLMELAQRAMALRATLNDALPVDDSPVILLPLSVAQAERVLAVLKGGGP